MNFKNKGLRIYSMTRFIIFLAILVLIAFLAGGLLFKSTVSGMEDPQYEMVRVMSGDTLWDIANEYNNDNKDVRNLICEICSINNMTANDLYPGQTIKIPIN